MRLAKVALLTLVAQAVGSAAFALAAPAPVPLLSVAWYPGQWPEAAWERDLALMEAAGVRMVRIGEYAWSSLEPE